MMWRMILYLVIFLELFVEVNCIKSKEETLNQILSVVTTSKKNISSAAGKEEKFDVVPESLKEQVLTAERCERDAALNALELWWGRAKKKTSRRSNERKRLKKKYRGKLEQIRNEHTALYGRITDGFRIIQGWRPEIPQGSSRGSSRARNILSKSDVAWDQIYSETKEKFSKKPNPNLIDTSDVQAESEILKRVESSDIDDENMINTTLFNHDIFSMVKELVLDRARKERKITLRTIDSGFSRARSPEVINEDWEKLKAEVDESIKILRSWRKRNMKLQSQSFIDTGDHTYEDDDDFGDDEDDAKMN